MAWFLILFCSFLSVVAQGESKHKKRGQGTTTEEKTEKKSEQPDNPEFQNPAFHDPWVQGVLSLKDPKLEGYLLHVFHTWGAKGLQNEAVKKRVEVYIARVHEDREPRFFLMGSIASSVAISGENDNLPSGTTIGGGNAPGTGIPDSMSLTLMGGYALTPVDQLAGIFLHSYRFSETDDPNFIPPNDVLGLNYQHQLSKNLSVQIAGTYVDTTGYQDPTLGISYTGHKPFGVENNLIWTIGTSLSAPISDKSIRLTKITTSATWANVHYKSLRWRTNAKLNYSYSFYSGTEYLQDRSGSTGGYSDEGDNSPSAPSVDVGFSSRELARTVLNLNEKYAIRSFWDVGMAAKTTYGYLDSYYSKWTSNYTPLSTTFHAAGFSLELAATLTSYKSDQDHFTLPSQLGAKISASYTLTMYGNPKPELFTILKEDLPSLKKKSDQ